MKRLLSLIAICLITNTTKAQAPSIDIKKFRENSEYRNNIKNRLRLPLNDSSLLVLNKPLLLNPLQPGIYRLPQDGMPCLVPDTKDIAAIPNFYKNGVTIPLSEMKPAIPNPYKNQPLLVPVK